MGKDDPLTILSMQGIFEDDCVLNQKPTRLADAAMQRPANQHDPEALNNLALIIVVVHLHV